MKNVLVCGGAGYIGSHVVLELHRSGFRPILVDNFCNSERSVVPRLTNLIGDDLCWYDADLTNIDNVRKVFFEVRPDSVIHLAGLKSVSASVRDPIDYYEKNLTITLNILKAMSEFRCRFIVFSSSATTYGEPLYLPIDESHRISPVNPYGYSKYFQEQIIKDWVLSDHGSSSAIILRYFNPVGADRSAEIGELPNGVPNNLMPILGGVAAKIFEKLVVFGDDYETRDGTCERDYIHVSDLAAAHVALLLAECKDNFDVFNVGTGEGVTVFEALAAYSACVGRQLNFEVGSRRQGDIAASVASNEKIFQMTSWRPKFNFTDACVDDFRWRQKLTSRNTVQ